MVRKSVPKKSSKKSLSVDVNASSPSFEMSALHSQLRSMQERMDRLFNSSLFEDPLTGLSLSVPLRFPLRGMSSDFPLARPLSDFYETKTQVCADVDLPGIEKKDIQLNVSQDRVEIKASKSHESREDTKGEFRMERSYSGFYRTFTLPSHADTSKLHATFENGVLHLRIPKRKSSSSPSSRRVPVE
ncbi:MAG: Hsp20/alpha crystallin family protein [Candidatus Diapherotrites archaeon]